MSDCDNNPGLHKPDHSVIAKVAQSAALTVGYRISVPILVAFVLFFGSRFVSQIDDMSKGLDGLALTMVRVATTVDLVSKRVEGLENRERQSGARGP